MSMTLVLLAVSVACNVWFLFLLLYDRIMETRLVRFFKDIARVWKALHAGERKKDTGQMPAQAADIIGKSHFKMTPNRTMATIPEPQAATSEEGIELSEEDTTFDDGNKEAEPHPAQVPAEKLDEVFSNIPPSEMEYGEGEPDDDTPDSRQASGSSFDEIDDAVRIARNPDATKKEKERAGQVFADMEGTELYEKLMTGSTEISIRIKGLIEIRLKKPKKKEFFIPDNIDEFDIRDYV